LRHLERIECHGILPSDKQITTKTEKSIFIPICPAEDNKLHA